MKLSIFDCRFSISGNSACPEHRSICGSASALNLNCPSTIAQRQIRQATTAYTLLELCITLAIVAIMSGFAIPVIRSTAAEDQLWSVLRDLRAAALQGRQKAVTSGIPSAVILNGTTITVSPWPIPADILQGRPKRNPADTATLETWSARDRRWQTAQEIWIFQPSGLSTPLRVRVRSQAGWIEQQYSPLTAAVEEEKWHFN